MRPARVPAVRCALLRPSLYPAPLSRNPPVRCVAKYRAARFDPAAVISYKEADKSTVERAIAQFYARMKDTASQRPVVWEVCELISACGRHQLVAEAEALFAAASERGGDVQRMEGTLHRAWCIAGVASKAEQMLAGRRREPTFKELHGMLLLYARNADVANLEKWMEKGRMLGVMTLKQYNVVLSGYGTLPRPL